MSGSRGRAVRAKLALAALASALGVLGACEPPRSDSDRDGAGSGASFAAGASGGEARESQAGDAAGLSGGTATGGTGGGGTALGGAGAGAGEATAGGGAVAGGVAAGGAGARMPQSHTASWVYVDGYRLMVGKRKSDGSLETPTPYVLKGVGWSPAGVGESNSAGYMQLYTAHAAKDVPSIAGLHANTVKTYDPFERSAQGLSLLDQLYATGIMVVMQVMAAQATSPETAATTVNYFKGHPAILAWLVGNEFNYNHLYGAASFDQALTQVVSAITAIHAADPDHPVMVGYGELPSASDYARIPADLWAINLYPYLDLASRFAAWGKLSNKPLVVGEYGADAFNNLTGMEDQASQASATVMLTTQITEHYSARAVDAEHVVVGGAIYCLSDEWWKAGNPNSHDGGGAVGAIYPDQFANEEWWGLTTNSGEPRQAYAELARIYAAN